MAEIHTQALTTGLETMRKQNEFCDFILRSDTKDHPCHKVILSAISDFFKTMFCSGMQEEMTGTMSFNAADELCEAFLTFVYTGHCELTNDNVESMLELGLQYQIPSLKTYCICFLNENLKAVNCVRVWEISKLNGMIDLEEKSRSLILKHFLQVYDTEDFLCLSDVEFVMSLLSEKNINCLDRSILCRAGLAWIERDFENRGHFIRNILKTCLSIGISGPIIKKCIEEFSQLYQSPECISETEKILSSCGSMAVDNAFSERHESLIIIGGSEGGCNQSVMCFSFRLKKWFSLAPVPRDPGYNFALCGFGLNLYLSGGTGGKSKLWKYCGDINEWRVCKDMPVPRQRHCIAAIGDHVYVLGGIEKQGSQPIKEIDAYTVSSNRWQEKNAVMVIPVRSSSCTVQGDTIFLFGGQKASGTSSYNELAQFYNTKLKVTGYLRHKIPEELKIQTRAITLDNKIYIISKGGNIYTFVERDEGKMPKVGSIGDRKFPRNGFGACAFEDKILIVGGEVNYQARKDMLLYNVGNNAVVEMMEKLPISIQGFCFAKADVMQTYLQRECTSDVAFF